MCPLSPALSTYHLLLTSYSEALILTAAARAPQGPAVVRTGSTSGPTRAAANRGTRGPFVATPSAHRRQPRASTSTQATRRPGCGHRLHRRPAGPRADLTGVGQDDRCRDHGGRD